MTDHPGWKPEGFMRKSLTIDDIDVVLQSIRDRIENHFKDYGDGIFTHPHEIVGCMFGQQMKLSTAADASIYSGDLTEFKERCMKTLLAMLVSTASVDKLIELRDAE
jgi:hypothetical protein